MIRKSGYRFSEKIMLKQKDGALSFGPVNPQQPFLRTFAAPAVLCALGLVAALAAVLQFSLRAYVPGSLDPGGFTLANFTDLLKPLYARVFLDTVWICFLTAVSTLIVGYPLAYALVRSKNAIVKSTLLVIVVTPLFLGEVVRTYSWIIVLGNNGFINSILLYLGIVGQPLQFMFTTFGVVVALVHVTMPVMVIMLAAALSHIDRDYQRAAESLGAGPVRVFLTVTLPLSMPGVVAGVTTAFAWTFSAFATPQLIGGGRVNMISNLVYQLGFASFNFPFAASLCVTGLALTIVVLSALRLASRRLETIEPH
jgi:putative spermidine/putrescine transport system permease protein